MPMVNLMEASPLLRVPLPMCVKLTTKDSHQDHCLVLGLCDAGDETWALSMPDKGSTLVYIPRPEEKL